MSFADRAQQKGLKRATKTKKRHRDWLSGAFFLCRSVQVRSLNSGRKTRRQNAKIRVGVDFAAAFEFGDGGVFVAGIGHAEFAVIYLGDFGFFGFLGLRNPVIGQTIGSVHKVVPTGLVNVGADKFPHEFVLGGDFKESAICAFTDKGVAIGKALHGTDQYAVEFVVFDKGSQPCFGGCVLPDYFKGQRVEFDHA